MFNSSSGETKRSTFCHLVRTQFEIKAIDLKAVIGLSIIVFVLFFSFDLQVFFHTNINALLFKFTFIQCTVHYITKRHYFTLLEILVIIVLKARRNQFKSKAARTPTQLRTNKHIPISSRCLTRVCTRNITINAENCMLESLFCMLSKMDV